MPSGRHLALSMAMLWGWSIVPAGAATIRVTIDKMAFSPAEVRARPGDTIVWVNQDAFVHTATQRKGFDLIIPPKKSASTVVTKAGSVDYYCRYHPNMKGRVIITPE